MVCFVSRDRIAEQAKEPPAKACKVRSSISVLARASEHPEEARQQPGKMERDFLRRELLARQLLTEFVGIGVQKLPPVGGGEWDAEQGVWPLRRPVRNSRQFQ